MKTVGGVVFNLIRADTTICLYCTLTQNMYPEQCLIFKLNTFLIKHVLNIQLVLFNFILEGGEAFLNLTLLTYPLKCFSRALRGHFPIKCNHIKSSRTYPDMTYPDYSLFQTAVSERILMPHFFIFFKLIIYATDDFFCYLIFHLLSSYYVIDIISVLH